MRPRTLSIPRRRIAAWPSACVIVLDAVGAGELPDAAEYGDEGSDTLGNVAKRRRRTRPAEPRGARPRQRRGARGLSAAAGRARDRGQARRALEGQGHDDRPLGADGRPDADAVPDVSARLSARRDRSVHAPHRPRRDRQQGRRPAPRSSRSSARSTRRRASGSSTRRPTPSSRSRRTRRPCRSRSCTRRAGTHARSSPASTRSAASSRGRSSASPATTSARRTGTTSRSQPKRPNYLSLVREAGHDGSRRRQDQRHLRRAATSTSRIRRSRTSTASRRPSGSCASSTTGFVFVNLVETDMLWGHRNDPGELPPLPAGLRPPAARPARRAAPRRPLHPHVRPRLRSDDAVDGSLARARAAARVRRGPLRERRPTTTASSATSARR